MKDRLPGKRSEILIYQNEDGRTRVDVRLENETVWLSQKLLAELFQKDVRTINEHIKNIYSEGELESEATIRKFWIVRMEGRRQVTRQVDFYNLDMIIARAEYEKFSLYRNLGRASIPSQGSRNEKVM